jgi:hypothetical protein
MRPFLESDSRAAMSEVPGKTEDDPDDDDPPSDADPPSDGDLPDDVDMPDTAADDAPF